MLKIDGTTGAQRPAPISPPPPGPTRQLLRPPRELVFAILFSLTLHLLAWYATPRFMPLLRESAPVSFDAVIVPIVVMPETPAPPIGSSANRVQRKVNPKATGQVTAQIRIAGFAVPADAFTADTLQQTLDERIGIVTTTTNEKGGVEESILGAKPAMSLEEAIQPTSSAAIEREPATPPAQELPARIAIAYNLSSNISDGVAEYLWTRDGNRFEIDSSMQATGFIIGNFVGILHQVSQGEITALGLKPVSYRIRRGEGNAETADFLHAANELKLTRGGEARLLPLPPRIQDMQSFLFQLSFDAPRLRSGDDRLEILVTNARKVYRHRFAQVGIETVQMRNGTVQAMHLRSEALDPEDAYEVWLAPDNYYLPIKIKFFAGRFPVELIATSIRTTP